MNVALDRQNYHALYIQGGQKVNREVLGHNNYIKYWPISISLIELKVNAWAAI